MSKKLHILFLSSWYPSKVLPTNGSFVQRHAEAIATQHKVTIIHVVSDKNSSKNKCIIETINNVETIIIYTPKLLFFWKFFYFFKLYMSAINNIEPFDLVHLNITFPKGLIAIYLKWFRGKPYIISEHWSGYQYPRNKSIGTIKKYLTNLIVKNSKFVCPVSKNLMNHMISFGLNGNYYPVPNAVNTNYFNLTSKIHGKFVITHVSGMNNESKNIIDILNVISELQKNIKNLEFNLIGNHSKKYSNYIDDLKISNINIVDNIPSHEVAEYLKRSDLFVLFSNYENLPCVILESFACGTPVVSSNVGGISEFFPNNFGYLVPPKNKLALKKAILKIYNSELQINKKIMAQYSKNNFGYKAICEKFTNLYYECLKN